MTTKSEPTSAQRDVIPHSLVVACEPGARAYSGIVIAAFNDPSVPGDVVCWADGRVAKSPPPALDGTVRPSFDRLVFTARSDGAFVAFLEAGYRDQMNVTPATG